MLAFHSVFCTVNKLVSMKWLLCGAEIFTLHYITRNIVYLLI